MFTVFDGKINCFDKTVFLSVKVLNVLTRKSYVVDCKVTRNESAIQIDPVAYSKRFETLRRSIESCTRQ
jgi:hypothetical protein